jgi:hypothetical protein
VCNSLPALEAGFEQAVALSVESFPSQNLFLKVPSALSLRRRTFISSAVTVGSFKLFPFPQYTCSRASDSYRCAATRLTPRYNGGYATPSTWDQ